MDGPTPAKDQAPHRGCQPHAQCLLGQASLRLYRARRRTGQRAQHPDDNNSIEGNCSGPLCPPREKRTPGLYAEGDKTFYGKYLNRQVAETRRA